MKRIITLLVNCFIFFLSVNSQTTIEELNYLNKGYKYQQDMGLDMKKGYELKEINEFNAQIYSGDRSMSFYGLFKEGQPAGILVIFKGQYTLLHYGLPLWMSENEVWNEAAKYYKSSISTGNGWGYNTIAQDYLWASLRMISYIYSHQFNGMELFGENTQAERIRREQEAERMRIEEERLRREQQADRLNRMGETTYGDRTGLGESKNYGLGNRTVVGALPPPIVDDCSVTSRIIVTVEIQVDRSGSVVGTSIKDATYSDPCINNAVLAAARKTRFTSDQNASFRQTGWIRYTIEP